MFGFMGKILRVDLTNSKISEEPVSEKYLPVSGVSPPESIDKIGSISYIDTFPEAVKDILFDRSCAQSFPLIFFRV